MHVDSHSWHTLVCAHMCRCIAATLCMPMFLYVNTCTHTGTLILTCLLTAMQNISCPVFVYISRHTCQHVHIFARFYTCALSPRHTSTHEHTHVHTCTKMHAHHRCPNYIEHIQCLHTYVSTSLTTMLVLSSLSLARWIPSWGAESCPTPMREYTTGLN